jgi:hypothetical protein
MTLVRRTLLGIFLGGIVLPGSGFAEDAVDHAAPDMKGMPASPGSASLSSLSRAPAPPGPYLDQRVWCIGPQTRCPMPEGTPRGKKCWCAGTSD